MRIVRQYGTMWARNEENIAKLPSGKKNGQGVYILFDGSMPMYAGKGNIRSRIKTSCKHRRRKDLWDHFSWYTIKNPAMMHDIEVLMLSILPPNLRFLTRQGGKFKRATEIDQIEDKADPISRKAVRK
jgi:hypothetical protein